MLLNKISSYLLELFITLSEVIIHLTLLLENFISLLGDALALTLLLQRPGLFLA